MSRIVIGVIGAIVGGALARAAGVRGLTGLSIRSLLVATLGASLLLFLLQAIEGRRR